MPHALSLTVFAVAAALAPPEIPDDAPVDVARQDFQKILSAIAADDPAAAKEVVAERNARPMSVPLDDGYVDRDAQRRAAEAFGLSPEDVERLLTCGIPEVVSETLGAIASLGEAARPYDAAVKRLAESEAAPMSLRFQALECRLWIVPENQPVLDKENVGVYLGGYYPDEGQRTDEMPEGSERQGLLIVAEAFSMSLVHSGHTHSALPALRHALQNGSKREQLLALRILTNFEREAEPIAEEISAYLNRAEDPILKQSAGYLLAQLENDPERIAAIADRADVPPGEREKFIESCVEAVDDRRELDAAIVERALADPAPTGVDYMFTLDYAMKYSRGNRVRLWLRALTPAAEKLPPAAVRRVEELAREQDGETARLARELLRKAGRPAGEPGEDDAEDDAPPDADSPAAEPISPPAP